MNETPSRSVQTQWPRGPEGTQTVGLPRVVRLGVLFALAGIGLLLLAPIGYRNGVFPLRPAFRVFLAGGVAGTLAAVFCLIGGFVSMRRALRGGGALALVGLLLGLAASGTVAHWLVTARHVPRIHDITTDTEHPPDFVALKAAREQSPNGAAYGGPAVAAQQRTAYAEIVPLVLSIPPREAFGRSLKAARGLGWKIVDSDPVAGRIEATDTTRWFGFKDDVVVRVTSAGSGSRIDVRSASHLGLSDVGTNAKRIACFLARVKSEK